MQHIIYPRFFECLFCLVYGLVLIIYLKNILRLIMIALVGGFCNSTLIFGKHRKHLFTKQFTLDIKHPSTGVKLADIEGEIGGDGSRLLSCT